LGALIKEIRSLSVSLYGKHFSCDSSIRLVLTTGTLSADGQLEGVCRVLGVHDDAHV
jgi:hypothetical protein